MLFVPCFIICLYLLQCNGAPPEEGTSKTPISRSGFSDEEDKLIIDELLRIDVGKLQLYSRHLWEHVSKKHREKLEQKAPGFVQGRSWKSLCSHFRTMLKYNHPRLNKKVPENLLRKFRTDLNKQPPEVKPSFTKEEEELIIQEWLKPSCTNPYASTTFQAIHAKHEAKWQANSPGFKTGRTIKSLHSHMYRMKDAGHLPNEVLKKFWNGEKGASSSCPTPLDQETDLEEMTKDSEDDL